MRKLVLSLALFGLAAGCSAPTGPNLDQFEGANPLLRKEIERRIALIPLQQHEDLVVNLCWLHQRGEYAVPQLIEALGHEEPKMRSNVMWVLGRIMDIRTIPFVRKCLNDSDPVVELETARALLTMGDDTGVPVLIAGLTSENRHYRFSCHEALRGWSNCDFGYNQQAGKAANEKAVVSWMQWWNKKSGQEVFPLNDDPTGLATPPAGPEIRN